MANTTTQKPYRELAHRETDGVEVVLFWHRPTDQLTVTVSDERNGAYFELPAEPHQALDVFNHPYAYAAFRGLTYQEALLPSSAEAVATGKRVVPRIHQADERG
jgi:hypothetical protein